MHTRNGSNRQAGFTYIGLLILVAITAAAATTTLMAGPNLQQRQSEAELIAIGQEFRLALISYAAATPQGLPTEPRSLDELLRDPRYPGVRRHLRRIYPDPLTGSHDWGLVRSPEGRIVGIHSLSRTPTLRTADFPRGLESLSNAERHDEWVFAPQAITRSQSERLR